MRTEGVTDFLPVQATRATNRPLRIDAPVSTVRRMAGVIVFDCLRRARAIPQRRRSTRQLARLFPHVQAGLVHLAVANGGSVARPRVLHGTSDVTVARLAPNGQRTLAMVKVARSEAAGAELAKQHAVLQSLRSDERLYDWNHLLPRSTFHRVGRDAFSLESALPGIDAAAVLRRRPSLREAVTRVGLDAIGGLHRRTARVASLERGVVDSWLESPITMLHTTHPSGTVSRAQHLATVAVERRLRKALTDRETTLSWVHGDFTPGNVILDATASSVTGIVDWGQARSAGLPALDAALWVLSLDAGRRGQPIGRVVRPALGWREWPADDALMALAQTPVISSGLGPGDLVLLCWLYHVADNLRNTDHYARHRWWWSANVDPVLELVSR